MKKFWISMLILNLALGIGAIGCVKKAASVEDAILQSRHLKSTSEQAKYLVKQSQAFLNSKEFNNAFATAQYVLLNLDKSSTEAKTVVEKARTELQKILPN